MTAQEPSPGDPQPATAQAAPGWYPDPTGQMRWWDGQAWGGLAQPTVQTGGGGGDPKTMAMLAELLGIFTGFIGPLIIYATNGDKDPFVKHHAAEALNFHLTVMIAYLVSGVLILLIIGILLLPVVMVCSLVFSIMATLAANRGEWYRYPISIRFVSGAVG